MGFFRAAHGWGAFLGPLPKISHTYPTMMKLGTVIPFLRKIQKMYKLRDTFTSAKFATSINTHIDWILIHNF